MRVLIADDQPAVRSALRLLLEQEPELTVIGDAATGTMLLAQVDRLQPDLILLDWELPGLPAEELLAMVRELYPQIVVVALSGRLGARQAALAAQADAFVSKGDPAECVLDALRALLARDVLVVKGCNHVSSQL